MAIATPKPATLKRYGLSVAEWQAIMDRQGGVCFVCRREPSTGRLCIDHEHVKGWKKMAPEQRKCFVRGLLCWVCNSKYLFRGITPERGRRVVEYLENYIARPKA